MSQSLETVADILPDNPTAEAPTQTVAAPLGILEARRRFLRDLPELLESHEGDWVACTRDRRIGCGPSKRELYRKCLGQGLKEDEFVVCSIEPGVPSEANAPVDVG